MRSLFFVGLFVTSQVAVAQVDPTLVGSWKGAVVVSVPRAGESEFPFTLQLGADGSCSFDEEPGRCTASGGKLRFKSDEVDEVFRYTLSGGRLTLSGGDLEATIVLTRIGGSPPREPEERAPPSRPEPPSVPVKQAPPGDAVSKPEWGASAVPPAGWFGVKEQGDVVVFGSKTEAGAVIVRFYPSATTEGMHAEFARGITESGVSLMPTGGLVAFSKGSAKGFAGELDGQGGDGSRIRARVIVLPTGFGGALAFAGLTTDAAYPTLKARTEQFASTVTFTKPKVAPVSQKIAGRYWFYSASSGGSSEGKITLCSDGRYFRGSEMSGNNGGGSAYAANTSGGRWTASGGDRGTLTLTESSGESSNYDYAISTNPKDMSGYGPALFIGSRNYQKTGDGRCQ